MNWKAVCLIALIFFAFAATTLPLLTSNLSGLSTLDIAQIGNCNIDIGEEPTGDPIVPPPPVPVDG